MKTNWWVVALHDRWNLFECETPATQICMDREDGKLVGTVTGMRQAELLDEDLIVVCWTDGAQTHEDERRLDNFWGVVDPGSADNPACEDLVDPNTGLQGTCLLVDCACGCTVAFIM